jgi:hypothetical protein
MKQQKIRIDLNRDLCMTCKKAIGCTAEEPEYGSNNNVIRCKDFVKVNKNKLRERAEKGTEIFHMTENKYNGLLVPKMRTDMHDSTTNTLYEDGNYFLSLNECCKHIEKLGK